MVFFNNIVAVKVWQGIFQIAGNGNILFILTDHNVLHCQIVYGLKFFRHRCCRLVVDFHSVLNCLHHCCYCCWIKLQLGP